ncbi:TFIIH/NER complex subunit SSL1 [Ascoidea rubescens DSM 1968]|uniref:General transcription and DNA repair factor IIH n=1 Tax=Ascoidea rubescens DSM 1968 TaxID=1344418 RepID=A0A1D2VCB1_9ASCO|nr:TFIIH basal transcription factor complex, subunit SSL1 [Ascoidea rubescens DSM 1968]ODV59266.1 TFIIH basal transcription factor complex, subunit SSL1 [Ascoidea rubescens DSM 1968]
MASKESDVESVELDEELKSQQHSTQSTESALSHRIITRSSVKTGQAELLKNDEEILKSDFYDNEDEYDDENINLRASRKRKLSKALKKKEKKTRIDPLMQGTNGGYAWEAEFKKPWDILQEDDSSLAGVVSNIVEDRKKRIIKDAKYFQRGIIRTLILIIDGSNSMSEKDLRPNRFSLTIQYSIDFIKEFFDQNPISQLGVLMMRDGVSTLVSELSGNASDHILALKNLKKTDGEPRGDASLQNALEMSRGFLLHITNHCTREVLIIFGSLLTLDPGDIDKTISSLVKEKIRVRIIGLSAQVAICEKICMMTNYNDKTTYSIILNESHFKELLMNSVTPLPINDENSASYSLIKMGFPKRISESLPSFCSCHSSLTFGGFICPNCHSKICSLPNICPCCNLMLISSIHLARSYHHLFPLKNFVEVPLSLNYKTRRCFGCKTGFPMNRINDLNKSLLKKFKTLRSSRYQCKDCKKEFCIDCDVLIHDTMHICPGCELFKN